MSSGPVEASSAASTMQARSATSMTGPEVTIPSVVSTSSVRERCSSDILTLLCFIKGLRRLEHRLFGHIGRQTYVNRCKRRSLRHFQQMLLAQLKQGNEVDHNHRHSAADIKQFDKFGVAVPGA